MLNQSARFVLVAMVVTVVSMFSPQSNVLTTPPTVGRASLSSNVTVPPPTAPAGRIDPECPDLSLSRTSDHEKVEKEFSAKVGMCSNKNQKDLVDTPPHVNDRMMDMYASILGWSATTPNPFRVIDIGSGCGYKLHSLTRRYNVQGLG